MAHDMIVAMVELDEARIAPDRADAPRIMVHLHVHSRSAGFAHEMMLHPALQDRPGASHGPRRPMSALASPPLLGGGQSQ
jgi:hypothetical protein